MAVALVCSVALAHTQDGSHGDSADSTDYYQITCSDDGSGRPASMMAQVQNRGPAAASMVSVVVHRGTAAPPTGGLHTGTTIVFRQNQ